MFRIIIAALIAANIFVPATVNDVEDEKVTITTQDGNVWSFYGSGYVSDQEIYVIFDDNNTIEVEDDKIIGILNIFQE